MIIGGRDLGKILRAPLTGPHYRAAFNSFRFYERPLEGLHRYFFASGSYPVEFPVKTPLGLVKPKLYSHHDLLTINEIFCRMDYPASRDDRVVVDFGSNIGISALFFLTRGPLVHCYLHEPLPVNVERLRENLRGFENRYSLAPLAVGLQNGVVKFGYEDSGRYGGIGLETGQSIEVPCRSASEILSEILQRHGRIDILKIDIEALEREILAGIPTPDLHRIRKIYVEQTFDKNPFPGVFTFRQYMNIGQFSKITSQAVVPRLSRFAADGCEW